MDRVLNKLVTSNSAKETETMGVELGASIRGGETVELISDIGGGKTTFVRGLVRGIGSKDIVASPTFTINRQYKAGKLTIYHFDFYRLNEAGIVADELAEVIDDPKDVIVVEWGDIVKDVLPSKRLAINFESTGETIRHLKFTYPESLTYLVSRVV